MSVKGKLTHTYTRTPRTHAAFCCANLCKSVLAVVWVVDERVVIGQDVILEALQRFAVHHKVEVLANGLHYHCRVSRISAPWLNLLPANKWVCLIVAPARAVVWRIAASEIKRKKMKRAHREGLLKRTFFTSTHNTTQHNTLARAVNLMALCTAFATGNSLCRIPIESESPWPDSVCEVHVSLADDRLIQGANASPPYFCKE